MQPEPKIIETLSAKKDRRAIEAQAAWKEHEAHELAVNRNMHRLREERLAREARAAALAAEPRIETKTEPRIKAAPTRAAPKTGANKTAAKMKPARARRKVAGTETGMPK